MNSTRTFSSAILFIFFVFADQLSKYIIRFFGGFYICNKGIAFGINLPNWLIIVLTMAIILSVGALSLNLKIKNLAFILNLKFSLSNYPPILILSGAISNLIDRLHYGCVMDFIDLKIWPASNAMRSIAGWPVFNLADIFICLGVFLLILKFNKK